MAITIPSGTTITNPWTFQQIQAVINNNSATFSGVTDANAAPLLNAMTTVPVTNIATSDIREYLIGSNELGNIIALATNTNASALSTLGGILGITVVQASVNAANAFMNLINYQRTFHSNMSTVFTGFTSLLTQLVTAGAISAATKTALLAMQVPATALWSPTIQTGDVTAARNLT